MHAAIPGVSPDPSRNLEVKFRVSAAGLNDIRDRLRELPGIPIEIQHQVDRYFVVPEGRLKLRSISGDGEGSRDELIAYRRPDTHGSRWSNYRVMPLAPGQGEALTMTLGEVLPVLVEVRKRREIAVIDATRVHLDVVEGLGPFVELETVVGSQAVAEAEREHREVIERLGLADWHVEATSYSDLLLHAGATEMSAQSPG